jgi:hypothetical protein
MGVVVGNCVGGIVVGDTVCEETVKKAMKSKSIEDNIILMV